MTIRGRSEDFGMLQKLVDKLYSRSKYATRLDAIILAEAQDLHPELQELVSLLPPGQLSRQQMCDQLNSSLSGHGWGLVYGTVE